MPEPAQKLSVAEILRRTSIFLPVLLFMGLWTWYFATAMLARQFSWSFWSLLLFALFLLVLTLTPRGRAARLELALASAKVIIDYEVPKQAEALVERIKEALPANIKPAVEEATPKLLEETLHALSSVSESAALQALVSSSAAQTATWPIDYRSFPDDYKSFIDGLNAYLSTRPEADWSGSRTPTEAMRKAIWRRMVRKPTDPSSGSAR